MQKDDRKILIDAMYDVMLDEYNAVRGWDSDGVVTEATKEKWGLNELLA